MRHSKSVDVVLHVILPVLVGCVLYYVPVRAVAPAFVCNYLPDGLWAYAFMSAILIVWNRQVNRMWVVIPFVTAVVFEWLQQQEIISGTGDWMDVGVYFLFFLLALGINKKISFNLNLN